MMLETNSFRCIQEYRYFKYESLRRYTSHEQCVSSHIERNASRKLLNNIRRYGVFLKDTIINEIDYLDPFEKVNQWKQENL